MTPEERDRMHWLCKQIEVEQDPKVFSDLANELDELLVRKEQRLIQQQNPQSN
jgi:hypothetical protein